MEIVIRVGIGLPQRCILPCQSKGDHPEIYTTPRLSSTDPTKVSTIERTIPICRFCRCGNERGQCKVPITGKSAAFHLDLLRASKSLRHPTSQTIRVGHPHSSHPRNGPLEGRHRRGGLIADCLRQKHRSLLDNVMWWMAPSDGIECAKIGCCKTFERSHPPWTRLRRLVLISQKMFSSFTALRLTDRSFCASP